MAKIFLSLFSCLPFSHWSDTVPAKTKKNAIFNTELSLCYSSSGPALATKPRECLLQGCCLLSRGWVFMECLHILPHLSTVWEQPLLLQVAFISSCPAAALAFLLLRQHTAVGTAVGWRTHPCSSCCLSQPLLLLLSIPHLLRGAIKQIFSLENPSTLPQRPPFWISAWSFLSCIIPHFHRHWLPQQPAGAPRLTPAR